MKVLKFGGTSVGSAARIKHVAKLIAERGRNIVVLSAMSGTTNTLASIADYLYKGNIDGAKETALDLYDHYAATLSELFANEVGYDGAAEAIKQRFDAVHALCVAPFTVDKEKELLAQGEMMSVAMMRAYLQAQGYRVGYLPALDIIAFNDDGEPDTARIGEALAPRLADADSFDLYLTEGFICRDARGRIDNLQRGGSDYTASLIGAAIGAEEIQIWTDIDGMHNNDPRYVEGTTPVNELHFEEAAELAYFGAKILHGDVRILFCKLYRDGETLLLNLRQVSESEKGRIVTADRHSPFGAVPDQPFLPHQAVSLHGCGAPYREEEKPVVNVSDAGPGLVHKPFFRMGVHRCKYSRILLQA